MRFANQVAVVTGAGRGIGRAIATQFASEGARVAVVSRTEANALTVADEINAKYAGLAKGYAVDAADHAAVQKLCEQVTADFSRVDILVNNAGIIRRTPAVDYSDADWDAVVGVNLNGVFTACRAAGKHMLARGSGKIINIASLLTFFGGITVPSYAAAKGGVGQLTKALSNEWSGKGVQVNAIAPGYMRTDNTAALQADPVRSKEILNRIPANRWGEPADLEGAIVFLASSASDYLSGHVMAVDGGWCGR
jgi:2-deoxy-D-gluconate 3-dehydrogenase